MMNHGETDTEKHRANSPFLKYAMEQYKMPLEGAKNSKSASSLSNKEFVRKEERRDSKISVSVSRASDPSEIECDNDSTELK